MQTMNDTGVYTTMSTTTFGETPVDQPAFATVDIPEYLDNEDRISISFDDPHVSENQIKIIEQLNVSYQIGKIIELLVTSVNHVDHQHNIKLAITNLLNYKASLK